MGNIGLYRKVWHTTKQLGKTTFSKAVDCSAYENLMHSNFWQSFMNIKTYNKAKKYINIFEKAEKTNQIPIVEQEYGMFKNALDDFYNTGNRRNVIKTVKKITNVPYKIRNHKKNLKGKKVNFINEIRAESANFCNFEKAVKKFLIVSSTGLLANKNNIKQATESDDKLDLLKQIVKTLLIYNIGFKGIGMVCKNISPACTVINTKVPNPWVRLLIKALGFSAMTFATIRTKRVVKEKFIQEQIIEESPKSFDIET